MKRLFLLLSLLSVSLSIFSQKSKFRIIETTDIHGNYFPYDYIHQKQGEGSMARIYTYVEQQRKHFGKENVILLDAGDILQGQPSAYYYNFVDTLSTHACADIYNFMQYDAVTIGNHDIEPGHQVYDRWVKQCHMPVLGANIIDTSTNNPYLKPYTIIERKGIKFAVFGLLTVGIPNWLPSKLWSGMRFEDLVQTSQKYMPEMRAKADVVIGLFHSGVGKENAQGTMNENASLQVAREVPGFDIIFCGHDHRIANRTIKNNEGKSVLVLNAGPNATHVAVADITIEESSKNVETENAKIVDIRSLSPNKQFIRAFQKQMDKVKTYTSRVIGYNKHTISTRPSFFGSSSFLSFVHSLQMKIANADISFAAPLSLDAQIQRGPITVADMFNLYPFENMIYLIHLSGKEVKDYLEYSYSRWANTMKHKKDHLLIFSPIHKDSKDKWKRLRYPSFNYDSAAGILYTVDVTKPAGERIHISSMSDGSPFQLSNTYKVAVNSYRGNGGGGLLTKGAGIPKDSLSSRLIYSSDRDLRYYMMKEIERQKEINPQPLNQWRFIPQKWTEPASRRDSIILYK